MKLSTRLTFAMVALVILTAAAVGMLTYRNIEAFVLPRAFERLELQTSLLAERLETAVAGARADVQGFSAALGLGLIVRAALSPDKIADGIPLDQWRARFAWRLAAELEGKPAYDQFRLIGLADGGKEIVRVDRQGPNGAIRVAPDTELRGRQDLRYFKEAMRLRAGGVFVSEVELDQEDGEIELPHNPVLHVATPVYAPGGAPFGLLVVNVELRDAFAAVRSTSDRDAQFLVINERGDYLVHPDPNREFGFERGTHSRLHDDFPDLAAAFGGTEFVTRVVRNRAGEDFAVAMANAQLALGPRVRVVEALPYATLLAATAAARDASVMAGVIAVLGAIGLAFIVARSLSHPLVQVTAAVEGLAAGRSVAVPTDAGGEIGVLAHAFARLGSDVKEKTEALTREIDERRRIVDTALDAFIQMDEGGHIAEWNSQAETIFGWTRDEALGQQLATLIVPPRNRQRHAEGLARFLATGEGPILARRFEIEALTRGGSEIWVELAVTALRRPDGYVFNGFLRDVTEKRTAEAQLRQSQKMDAVGQLTGGVAHDFNNILTVITGAIEIVAEEVADRPQLVPIVKLIDHAATRGAELTSQLLAFARRQALEPRRIDVNQLVVETAKLLRPTLGEHIEIESMLVGDAWPALADPGQLSTALINLAVNARDAMPAGGKLTLETGNAILDEAYARVNPDAKPGAYVMIAVSDTGLGIPAVIRDKVFEPFFTTKEIGKGTGLGLSMVYGFVKQSGGHIKIYSEEGHGTVIKVYLPRASAAPEKPEAAADIALMEHGSETVLVVEDDSLVRDYVVAQLKSLSYTTLAADNAAAALAFVEQGAHFDLLFTDVIMPGGMNGRQLAEEIGKRRPGIKVLYTSGYTENAVVHHGRLDPGVALLNKPYRKADLARRIREVLGPA